MQAHNTPAVLFLTHSGQIGGAELSLADLVRPYAATSSCLIFQSGPLGEFLRATTGITVNQLNLDFRSVRRESGPSALAMSALDVLKLSIRIQRLAGRFDVIYTNTLKSGVVGLLAGMWSHCPVIVHLRDILSAEHFSMTNRLLFTSLTRYLSSTIIANSQATAQAYIAAGGHSRGLRVIYPGFDASKFGKLDTSARRRLRVAIGIPEDSLVVGCFSRISPWKGQDVLLRALAQQQSSVVLLIVGAALFGEDKYLHDLKTLTEQLRLSDRVFFVGFRNDTESLLSLCDVVVHPSTSEEPFGRTVVEAQLSGKLVIGTNSGGIREIIQHEQTGLLVPAGDWQALSHTLSTALADSDLRYRIGLAARTTAIQKFSLVRTQQVTGELIKEVAERRRS